MRIKLKKLQLINFRGESNRTTEFTEHTTISGDNGVGKSRQFDAFIWLLYGKDSQDRKDYNVKTCIGGETQLHTTVEVNAEIDVDGQLINLRRRLVENWKQENGKESFRGNVTETYYNEVPVTLTEYNKRISKIVDGTIFKMVSNPMYFFSLKWQDQRQQLFNIVGDMSDEELARDDEQIAAFLESISGKSIDDYKREIAERKKRLQKQFDEISPRIEQTRRLSPEVVNEDELNKNLAEIEEKIAELNNTQSDANKALDKQQKAKIAKVNDATAITIQVNQIVQSKNAEETKKIAEIDGTRRQLELRKSSLEKDMARINREIELSKSTAVSLLQEHTEMQQRIERKREDWFATNKTEWGGSTVCPTCGQQLPQDAINNALAKFDDNKRVELNRITTEGKLLASQLTDIDKRINCNEQKLQELRAQYQDALLAKDATMAEMQALPPVSRKVWTADEIDECKILLAKAKQLREEANAIDVKGMPTYDAEFKQLHEQRDKIMAELSRQGIRKTAEQEIKRLEQLAKDLAQQLAEIRRGEDSIKFYTKAKIDKYEKRINSRFEMVEFKLFRTTLEGELVETCQASVNGIPYGTANTASQINAGIDLINTLSDYYNVSAPIWVDNRESVVRLIKTNSQLINLVVEEGKPFTITND